MRVLLYALLGTGVSLAAAPPHTLAVTGPQAERWTKTWQKRLDLGEWRISTQIVRASELKPDTLGNLHWNNETRTAVIRVLNPLDYDIPSTDIPLDIEYTIVHELIHLQLAALPRDPGGKNVEERVVNRISEALFQLDKGENYRPRPASARTPAKPKTDAEASRGAP
jgi:hypothetical protein